MNIVKNSQSTAQTTGVGGVRGSRGSEFSVRQELPLLVWNDFTIHQAVQTADWEQSRTRQNILLQMPPRLNPDEVKKGELIWNKTSNC